LLKRSVPRQVWDGVIEDACFAFDNPAIWRFSTPNVYLPFNVLAIWTDKHFEFHGLVPSLLLTGISVPGADMTLPVFNSTL
jgi:hypothetical protein